MIWHIYYKIAICTDWILRFYQYDLYVLASCDNKYVVSLCRAKTKQAGSSQLTS